MTGPAAARVAASPGPRKARVYRLSSTIKPGTPLVDTEVNECAIMLAEALDEGELPASLALRFVAWQERCDKTSAHLRTWSSAFISDWNDGLIDLPASGMRGGVVRRGDWWSMNSRELALSAVLMSGIRGVTVSEARRLTGVPGNGISGGLSLLHKAGVLGVIEGERR